MYQRCVNIHRTEKNLRTGILFSFLPSKQPVMLLGSKLCQADTHQADFAGKKLIKRPFRHAHALSNKVHCQTTDTVQNHLLLGIINNLATSSFGLHFIPPLLTFFRHQEPDTR